MIEKIKTTAKIYNGTDTYLWWTTLQENGLSHFEIQRSHGTRQNWETTGSVPAAGDSINTLKYKYLDEYVFAPFEQREATFYYRIKIVEMSGRFRYSSALKIVFQTPVASNVFLKRKVKLSPY